MAGNGQVISLPHRRTRKVEAEVAADPLFHPDTISDYQFPLCNKWKCQCGCGLVVFYRVDKKKVVISSPLFTLNPRSQVFRDFDDLSSYLQDLYSIFWDRCVRNFVRFMQFNSKAAWT